MVTFRYDFADQPAIVIAFTRPVVTRVAIVSSINCTSVRDTLLIIALYVIL